ncbi:GNAT family N-acetyltransferase [Rhizobium lusitanum]|uniref:Protein N-acetyltransferase, RimJ/RimL family n=1 Tax=Rhizobium lusitanum TaxID=293958 RepID=A0A1C3VHH9_9HYPH|nr:GNAT family N-acetyltransferase [Rhizobium lusitanum]SCB26974.1 Protein N-acetyltransferase, RimJ/RimL family [Rhizobium lusitanum]
MIETARLVLRKPLLSDASSLFEFLGDPEAMQFTHTDASLKDCRQRIAVYERRRRRDGYAPWTAILKSTGRAIGWGGLYDDPFDSGWGVELGYYFHPGAWGHGYGSEFVSAALAEADHTLKLAKVGAFARPENRVSRRLLEKAGFELIRFVPEIERFFFERQRPTALTSPAPPIAS